MTSPSGGLSLPDAPQLRPLEEADVDELHALIEADRERLAQWLPWAAGQDREGTAAFIDRGRKQFDEALGLQAAIVLDRAIVGIIGCHPIDWDRRSAAIGYWLAQAGLRRGVMTEAVRTLTGHAFESWDLHRIEIQAATANLRSRAIPERLGFTEEGTLRESERVGERYLDIVVYGMLAAEWSG